MTTSDALHTLGVTNDTLTPAEIIQLDTHGFLTLYDVLDETQLAAITVRIETLITHEGDAAGSEVGQQEKGVIRLSNLPDKGAEFDVFYTHPRVLAGIAHVLSQNMKLSSLNFRSSLPGFGRQGLHTDGGNPVAHGAYYVCNSIWLLDDFTAENGATRLIPGSHRATKLPNESMEDVSAPHPDEILLMAPRGSVTVFNSHVWHGGTQNRTDNPRRALHSYWTRREYSQQLDQRKWVSQDTSARISPAARFLLDVE